MWLSRRRSRSVAARAALFVVFTAGGSVLLGQASGPVRRALPVTEPPVQRALPVDQAPATASPRPVPPAPNNAPADVAPQQPPPAAEQEQADRRQLEYAIALYRRKLYDLAVPEFEKYLQDYDGAPGEAQAPSLQIAPASKPGAMDGTWNNLPSGTRFPCAKARFCGTFFVQGGISRSGSRPEKCPVPDVPSATAAARASRWNSR